MALAERSYDRVINPIDLVEQLAQTHDWPTDRTSDDELTLIVAGTWTDYHVSLNWRDDLEALHLACAFDFRVPENRLTEMYRLVAQINEQLWLGHFDLVDAGRPRHVPPRPAAERRGGHHAPVRSHAAGGARRLRALLSGLPVRRLGG